MFWCCRFILPFVVSYVVKNQLHTVSALDHKAKTTYRKFHQKHDTNSVKQYWTTPLQTSEAIQKDMMRELRGLVQPNKRPVIPSNTQSTKQTLLNYFRRISNSKTISGLFVFDVGGSSNEGVRKMQKIAGVSPGIITTQMPMYTSGESQWTSFADEVISNWKNKYLVRIQWWGGNPLIHIHNFTDTSNKDDKERRWRDFIRDGGVLNNVWKKELDKIVPYLHKLQSAGVIPVFDILPTINDNEYFRRGRPGVEGTAKLYKITRDYLTKQHNLTSLIWNWSLNCFHMNHFEDFWPGSDYVDVASVFIGSEKQLPWNEYERLRNLVGEKPVSMEDILKVPSVELLTLQPRWTWFTVEDYSLDNPVWNTPGKIKATLSSPSVISKSNIDFFNQDY